MCSMGVGLCVSLCDREECDGGVCVFVLRVSLPPRKFLDFY